MALPKRKYAAARQGGRRSHLHLVQHSLTACPHCQALRLPHRACPKCGYYKNVEVIATGKSRSQKA